MRLPPIRLVVALCCALVFAFVAACVATAAPQWQSSGWLRVHEREGTSLRGLSVVGRSTIWASGTGGAVLRSIDGGGTWHDVGPAEAGELDFRDVHGFDADTALAMVAGQPARVYRTADGGASWAVVFEDPDPAAFFDGIAFAGDRGFLFGDPVAGAFCLVRSEDRGLTWCRIEATRLPGPAGAEAGFAASGGCVQAVPDHVWIGTGGETARCLISRDRGESWDAQPLPLLQGLPSQGAFGVAFRGDRGVVVGGDYRAPERSVGSAAWTADGGRTWHRAGAGGFRSGAVWLDDHHVLAVGADGASLSADGGRTWEPFGTRGFHAVERAADGTVFACGDGGRIALLLEGAMPAFEVMALFGDHMVLPPTERVVLRGKGAPGAEVEIEASWGETGSARVDDYGRWGCPVLTPGRGGPYTVTLACGDERRELTDVLIGDVWLGSGQSNMEMPVGHHGSWRLGVDDWEAEVAAADYPALRVFTVERATSGQPLDDVVGEWKVCTPESVGEFSAASYFFARELVRAGKGPIGVVVSSWGGTVCEAWTRGEALGPFPEFAEALAKTREPVLPLEERTRRFWNAVPAAPPAGDWSTVQVPGRWSEDGLGDFDGVAFYRRTVDVPTPLRGKPLQLELGAIDDMDTTWCNGVRVGGMEESGSHAKPRSYLVPGAVTKGHERLEIVVRVVDTGGEGGISAEEAAVRLFSEEFSYTIPLAGAWERQVGTALDDLPAWPAGSGASPNRPAVLYNAMIAPLVPFPFAGAIWYQGESNRNRAAQYSRLFPAMIRDWRQRFGREFPFYFVQIAPFGYTDSSDDQLGQFHQAQAAALKLPRTGMAVTLDVGDARDIHPRKKQAVGRRLALHALRDPYGLDVVADGPRPARVEPDGDALRITFAAVGGGLAAEVPVTGFEVAGAEGDFVAAEARIDGDGVVVRAPGVAAPTRVRYAWGRMPAATLRNGAGLPAAPFVTGVSTGR